MGADVNGDGVVYDRNDAGEHSGVESSDNGDTDNGGTGNE